MTATALTATVPLAPSRRLRGGRRPRLFISLAIHLAVLLAMILVIPRFPPPEEPGSPQGVEMVFEKPTQQPTPPGVPNLPKPGVLPTPTAPPVPNAPPTLAAPAPPTPPPAPQQAPAVNLAAPPPVPQQAVPLPPAVPPQPPEAKEIPVPPVPPAPQEQALARPPTPRQEARPRQQAARPRPMPREEASLAHPMARSLNQSSTNVAASFFNPFGRPAAEQPPAASDGPVGSAMRTAAGMLAPFAYFPDGDPGPDFRRSLMAWWLAHRFYPPQAAAAGEDGDVHISLAVDRLGRVRDVQLNLSSGSTWLDMAGVSTWRGAQLIPLPDSMGRDNIMIDLTLHYILIRR